MPFSLVFLGTSAATPSKNRNVSSYALRNDEGKIFLLDCGEGTQHQFLKTVDLKVSKIEVILITHLHGDHSFGLPGLLASLSLYGRDQPVRVFGPVGLRAMIETNLKLSATYLTYKLDIVELEEGKTESFGLLHGLYLSAYPLKHKVPCFGYLLEEPEKKGKLNAQKAKELGVTNPKDLGSLSQGKDITLPNGTLIKAVDVTGETRKGKKFIFLGDTSNSDSMIEKGQDCDVVVHEATYDGTLEQKAVEGGHSTSVMAGKFASKLNAKKLILTHFSMRYQNPEEGQPSIKDLVKEAQLECSKTEVDAAEDMKKYEF